jgi:hypothetical protein
MNRLTIFALVFCAFHIDAQADLSPFAGQRSNTPIADAVAEFNREAALNPIGKTQPPLTVAEVIAAIRGFSPEAHPHSEIFLQRFKTIAQTGIIPAGCYLSFICGWTPNKDYDYVVWWIDLCVHPEKAGEQVQGGYGYNSSKPHEETPAFTREQQILMDALKRNNASK